MRIFALLFIYVAASPVFAGTLEEDYVRRMSRAKNSAEVKRVEAEFAALKVARAACRLQMRAKIFPAACYETLNLENHWGLHPKLVDRRRITAKLDDLCAESASALKIPRAAANGEDLSPACRKNLARAREIQEYRRERPE